ncbi:MAG: TonB-dependent receptor [Syntrophaceae bacterium]|nr:TonB-dependent receptor [Syntrophaceae bacterium]
MNRIPSHLLGLLTFILIIILLAPCAYSQERCKQWAGKVVSIQGTVQVRMSGETQWQSAKLNNTYCPGDTIRVLDKSRADVALINQPVLRLDQNTTLTLRGLKEEKTSIVELIKGAAHFFSRAPKNLEVNTAFVNAGIEGTEFFIRVDDDKTFLSVFEGKVLASNEAGRLTVVSNQSAVAEKGKAPEFRVVVKPRDAVQWTLYYPPVIYVRPGEPAPREDIGDPRYLTHRASLLISVGRVDEARADLDKALSIAPNNSDALALQSIIAVTQNEKDKALTLAKKAVEADPKSASARIALSYAQQANFDLEGARASLEEAVKLNPENALAWARLAEVWLMFAELNKGLNAAQKAVSLNPDLSRTQTVLGFAYLTQVKVKDSKRAFERAIELDQADPLPRLGLGLAKIREGGFPKWDKDLMKMIDSGLKEGTRDLEIAVSLDPDNSLIRSYLGKAYYEKTQDKLATDQFEMAKKLDPSDPTPYFYDAIEKQTTNRPVEALYDLQKAIELNDNRAVYRSRMLLDADLAARSASLARIYNDLGFQQRALVEGWKSVNTDPADFSGHRFLADTYSALPRHEIARVSELLISQLLQPINITPIQPHLAESNLFVLSGAGPADPSFNEFNPLFNRNRLTLQTSVIVGNNATFGEEVVGSGIYDNASFSIGQYYFKTNGFREGNDLKDKIFNAFVQYNLFPDTSIQGEFRYRDTITGDPTLRFDPRDFAPNLQDTDEKSSIRIGFHHAFSPDSHLIGNFMYQQEDLSEHDKPLDPYRFLLYSSYKYGADAYSAELQHLFRWKFIRTIFGAGYFNIDSKEDFAWVLNFPPPTPIPDRLKRDIDHTNIYLYTYINYPKNVTVTVGGSADFLEGGDKDKKQFNPKFGITWNPFPGTTLRGGVFRTLKRTLITNQTLEPTQVAGFNQFFDDWNATKSWRYGIALDQKFSKSIYGGAEFSLRELEFPYTDYSLGFPVVKEEEWKERIARGYLYWTPHKWFGLSAEYLYERIKREIEFSLGVKKVETHRVPLGINFYHPCGLSAMLKASFVKQHGDFERQNPFATGTFISDEDKFWLFDTAISYRLPKRYGFISVGAKNLLNKHFKFFDPDYFNPSIQPGRFIYTKITLALP